MNVALEGQEIIQSSTFALILGNENVKNIFEMSKRDFFFETKRSLIILTFSGDIGKVSAQVNS